jgi:hypothetical protein
VLDERRILTCTHAVDAWLPGMPWVAFPMATSDDSAGNGDTVPRRQVESVIRPQAGSPVRDLLILILILAEPVPAGVTPATLRCPGQPTWPAPAGGRSAFPPATRSATQHTAR